MTSIWRRRVSASIRSGRRGRPGGPGCGTAGALPAELLLFGSDYPAPAFPLHDHAAATGSPGRHLPRRTVTDQFKALLALEVDSLLIPDRNVIHVTFDEMWQAFPDHPMSPTSRRCSSAGRCSSDSCPGWRVGWRGLTRWRRRDG